MRIKFLIFSFTFFALSIVPEIRILGQKNVLEILQESKKVEVPINAVDNASKDISLINQTESKFTRYIWVPSGKEEDFVYLDFCMNSSFGRTNKLVKCLRIGNTLARISLIDYVANKNQLSKLIESWEFLLDDEPYFNIDLITEFVVVKVKSADIKIGRKTIGRCHSDQKLKFYETNGNWIKIETADGTKGWVKKDHVEIKVIKTKEPGVHCGQNIGLLSFSTGSNVPIVRYDWFVKKITTTLDGGLYYKFRGISKSTDKKITDQDFFLKSFGVDEKIAAQLRSDAKAITFFSNVTAKPRTVVILRGLGGNVTKNQGLCAITKDISDGNNDPKQDPTKNIIDHKYDASEIILEMNNGLQCFAVFDGNGNLQNSAPENVVVDHTIPTPFTRRLQPSISCIRCHTLNDVDEGWKPLKRDIKQLLESGIVIFGERKDDIFKNQDSLDRIHGLLSGIIDKPLIRARDDLSDSCLILSSHLKAPLTVSQVYRGSAFLHDRYEYFNITPQIACYELGFYIEDKSDAQEALRLLLKPVPNQEESPVIAAIKLGIPITRKQWEPEFPSAINRSMNTVLQVIKGVK